MIYEPQEAHFNMIFLCPAHWSKVIYIWARSCERYILSTLPWYCSFRGKPSTLPFQGCNPSSLFSLNVFHFETSLIFWMIFPGWMNGSKGWLISEAERLWPWCLKPSVCSVCAMLMWLTVLGISQERPSSSYVLSRWVLERFNLYPWYFEGIDCRWLFFLTSYLLFLIVEISINFLRSFSV